MRFRSIQNLQIGPEWSGVAVGGGAMKQPEEENDSQAILLGELSRANLTDLVLSPDGEDVFQFADGQVTTESATALPSRTPPVHCSEILLEITAEGMQAAAIEQRRRAKQHYYDKAVRDRDRDRGHIIDCEETLGQKIEKIMNRIVVRRQRAYLIGLLQDPSKARTAQLIEQYQKRAANNDKWPCAKQQHCGKQ